LAQQVLMPQHWWLDQENRRDGFTKNGWVCKPRKGCFWNAGALPGVPWAWRFRTEHGCAWACENSNGTPARSGPKSGGCSWFEEWFKERVKTKNEGLDFYWLPGQKDDI
jgi:hypothetical protein